MKTTYYKVKNGRQYKIRKPNTVTKNKLLDSGFTVTRVIEDGNKTKILSINPGKRPKNLISRISK